MTATLSMSSRHDSTHWALRLLRGARYATSVMAAVGVLGLLGWIAGFPGLTAFGGEIPALPSEATMLLAGAFGLAALHGAGQGGGRHAARAMAAFIALVATFALLRRMDVPVSPGLFSLGDPEVPRGSVSSASAFLIFAAALAVATGDGVGARRCARWLATIVAGVAWVALLDRGFQGFEERLPAVSLAVPSALGLLAGSLSVLALCPPARLLQLLERSRPVSVLLRYLLPPAIALPILVGWLRFLAYPSGRFTVAASGGVATFFTVVACTVLVVWALERLDRMYGRRSAELDAASPADWLEVTLASIDDAVITADTAGRIGLINPAAEALLGIPSGTGVGRAVCEVVQLSDEVTGEAIPCPVEEALASRMPVNVPGEPCLRLADGSARAVEISALPIPAVNGALAGAVLVMRDVAVRRARERALRDANAELDHRVGERTHELERTMDVLSETVALLDTFAATTPELIIAKDRAGRITMINPAALRALGLTQEQAVGCSKMELYGESEETRHIYECDQQVLESGQPVTVEEHLVTPLGRRTFLVTKSPLRDKQGRVFGLVGVATDITDRKQAQRELEKLWMDEHRLRGQAEEASRAKDEFLAIVSHELRSPLNALKGWSHVLSGTPNPDAQLVQRGVQAIKRNVEQQTRLIDDLLDTSRIVNGKLTLEKRVIDLVDVVHSAIEQTRGALAAKKIDLRFKAEDPVVSTEGDPGRLQQVVINLVSNAVKFTPDEGVIEVGLRRVDGLIELSVMDNGIGIDADFLPHVFDRFSQADSSTTRPYWGLGIGLALVRHLVELHGGTVRASSPGPGLGSRFTIELPATQGSLAGLPAVTPEGLARAGVVLGGIRVLLVDDDADAREALQFVLEQAGAEVHGYDSGRALLRALGSDQTAEAMTVLVLDIAMPGEDGFSVLAQVRKLEGLPFMPAIAVTALTYLDRPQFERGGFQDCFGKPLDPQRLIKAIAVLATRGAEKSAA